MAARSQENLKPFQVTSVNDHGNLRPQVRGVVTREVRAVMPGEQPNLENLGLHSKKISKITTNEMMARSHNDIQVKSQKVSRPQKDIHVKGQIVSKPQKDTQVKGQIVSRPQKDTQVKCHGASIKDLCVEDKKRVASLIKELARLGEEKENAEKNMEKERKHFEEQLLSLIHQQEQILRECEEQKKLLEYQSSILKLQIPQQEQTEKFASDMTDLKTKPEYSTTTRARGHALRTDDPVIDMSNIGENDRIGLGRDVLPYRTDNGMKELKKGDEEVNNCSLFVHTSWCPVPDVGCPEYLARRHFTYIIDQELRNQRQLLAAGMTFAQANNLIVSKSNSAMSHRQDSGKEKVMPHIHGSEKEMAPRQDSDKVMSHRHGSEKVNAQRHNSEKVMPGTYDSDEVMTQRHSLDKVTALRTDLKVTIENKVDHQTTQTLNPHAHEMMTSADQPDLPVSRQPQNNWGHIDMPVLPKQNEVLAQLLRTQVKSANYKLHSNQEDKEVSDQTDVCPKSRSKLRNRGPPPPTYGPLYAPVMSSTQKSSEFGDSFITTTNIVENSQQFVNAMDVPLIGNKLLEDKRDLNQGNTREGARMTDKRQVDKHEKLFALEKKSELLRQRYLLLKEQEKLRKMLSEDQAHLGIGVPTTEVREIRKEQEIVKASNHLTKKQLDNPQTSQEFNRHISEVNRQPEQVHTSHGPCSRKLHNNYVNDVVKKPMRRREVPKMNLHPPHNLDKPASRMLFQEEVPAHFLTEVQDKLPVPEERQLVGVDGDVCTVYTVTSDRDIVKRLDYSMHSDTDEIEINTEAGMSLKNESHTKVDSWQQPQPLPSAPTTDLDNHLRSQQASREETLSVIEIIQTLADAKWEPKINLSKPLDETSAQDNLNIAGEVHPTTDGAKELHSIADGAGESHVIADGLYPTSDGAGSQMKTSPCMPSKASQERSAKTRRSSHEVDSILELFELRRTRIQDLPEGQPVLADNHGCLSGLILDDNKSAGSRDEGRTSSDNEGESAVRIIQFLKNFSGLISNVPKHEPTGSYRNRGKPEQDDEDAITSKNDCHLTDQCQVKDSEDNSSLVEEEESLILEQVFFLER